MMAVEIAAGWFCNSMALLADGFHEQPACRWPSAWSAFAYAAAPTCRRPALRLRHLESRCSAVSPARSSCSAWWMVMVTARSSACVQPEPIHYQEAMLIAVIGLVVNLPRRASSGRRTTIIIIITSFPSTTGAAMAPTLRHHHHDLNLKSATSTSSPTPRPRWPPSRRWPAAGCSDGHGWTGDGHRRRRGRGRLGARPDRGDSKVLLDRGWIHPVVGRDPRRRRRGGGTASGPRSPTCTSGASAGDLLHRALPAFTPTNG